MDVAEYCRELETYLCRKNEGHLVRIVGPAFEQVCGWAAAGVPLKVAFRGIDQYCERYYAKGPRRRPVRIEFCEADILDLFDDWRRAVGVAGRADSEAEPAEPQPRKPSLVSHIERSVARLASARTRGDRSAAFATAAANAIRELEEFVATARSARGEARAAIIARLAEIDRDMLEAASRDVDPATAEAIRKETQAELAPFGSRMAPEERARAQDAAYTRLVRETFGLPAISYE